MYRQDASPDRSVLVTAFLGQVIGLDRATGELRWETKVIGGGDIELAIGDGVVIAVGRTHLAFLDYLTGAVYATVPIAGGGGGRPSMVVDGGFIYVGILGEISCYTLQGRFVWLQPLKGRGADHVALGLPGNVRQVDTRG